MIGFQLHRCCPIPALNGITELQNTVRNFLLLYHRFALLSRIRLARGFATLEGRRTCVLLRLLAMVVLFQSQPSPGESSVGCSFQIVCLEHKINSE